MRTTTTSLGSISYPDEICFAFNPTYVKITDCNVKEVTLRISAASGSFPLNCMAYNNTVIANISRALQMLFDTYNIVDVRCLDTYVEVYNGASSVFDFHTSVVWGNIAPGETFNGSRTVRWFDNWPMYLTVFDGGEFQDLNVITDLYYTVNPWDYTFDYTFRPTAQGKITFIHDSRKDGMFLRWIDRHGKLQYWLFDIGVKEIKNDDGGQELVMNYVDKAGNSFRSIKRQQYFYSKNTLHLCAPNVNEEEYTMLESILTSPVIDLYHREGIAGWEPVMIYTSTVKRKTDILQDFEFKILLPNTNAQSL